MTPERRFDAVTCGLAALLAAAIVTLAVLGSPRPLAVVGVSPAPGSSDVPPSAQVTVTFNRPIDPASARASISVSPYVEGFASAAGRRVAFTAKAGFRADADYTVTVAGDVRDRGGRRLADTVVARFRTRPQSLVLRTADGRLLAARQEADGVADPIPLAPGGVGAFAVGPAGEVAYVLDRTLVVATGRGEVRHHVALPEHVEVTALEWAAGGAAVIGPAASAGGGSAAFQVRLDVPAPAPLPLGPALTAAETDGFEAGKRRLAGTMYRAETFSLMPDGQSVILRDADLAYAVFGLDGRRRRTFGAFLAVGSPSPSGEAVVFVDADPADPVLARQVILFERTGRLRSLSPAGRDSHDPRFANRHERVAFASGPAAGPLASRRHAIDLLDLASGVQRRLTSPPPGETDGEPRWSPDDAFLLFRRWPVGRPEAARAFLVPADGTTLARPLGEDIADARWHP